MSVSNGNTTKMKSRQTRAKEGSPKCLYLRLMFAKTYHRESAEKRRESKFDGLPCRFFMILVISMVDVL